MSRSRFSPSPFDRRPAESLAQERTARDGHLLGPGDLGRRIAQRRNELGLTEGEVERRAHFGRGYLRYLETGPNATLGAAALQRLAWALETTAGALRGESTSPPGSRTPRHEVSYTRLSPADCERLVGDRGIGRFVFDSERGPVALPVNYVVADGDILFRTASETSIDRALPDAPASFEVDVIDDTMRTGWSVLFTGKVERVEAANELGQIEKLGLDPWAGGRRDVLVRLMPIEVSGRRIDSAPS